MQDHTTETTTTETTAAGPEKQHDLTTSGFMVDGVRVPRALESRPEALEAYLALHRSTMAAAATEGVVAASAVPASLASSTLAGSTNDSSSSTTPPAAAGVEATAPASPDRRRPRA